MMASMPIDDPIMAIEFEIGCFQSQCFDWTAVMRRIFRASVGVNIRTPFFNMSASSSSSSVAFLKLAESTIQSLEWNQKKLSQPNAQFLYGLLYDKCGFSALFSN
jgi:hypothetical protein